jgi:hypothetical protein
VIPPFEIFKVDAPRKVTWIETVNDLDIAKAIVRVQMRLSSCEYVILSQETGNKISIKPTDGNADSPPTQASH